MLCTGSEALPCFLFPLDAHQLLCGEGNFTCCQRGHVINGASIECDKVKVRELLEVMIDNKTKYLEETGQQVHMRWIECMRQYTVSGLPKLTKQDDASSSQEPSL